MNVTILGTGYVGLTTGACLAYLGHKVTCVDADPKKIRRSNAERCRFIEPHLADLVADARRQSHVHHRLRAGDPRSAGDFHRRRHAAGTEGSPDLRYLESAARGIGEHLGDHFTVIVNKSTVPIGSGNWVDSLVRDAFQKRNGGATPARSRWPRIPNFCAKARRCTTACIRTAWWSAPMSRRPPRCCTRCTGPFWSKRFPAPAYLPRPDGLGAVPLISTDLASAELIKYAANAFLSLKISYINEIGQLAEKVGADIAQVAKGIGLDARIGTRFLQAGIGWGGSCFGKDTAALVATAAEYGLEMPIVKAAREVNRRQRERVVDKLLGELKILKGRTIGLLGLAFKPNTDDLRDAPAIDIAKKLIERGARVKAHDPVAMERFRQDNPSWM